MAAEVTIVDYGLGNLAAFMHVYERLNIDAEVASSPDVLLSAKRLILPGVGSFDWAMTRLNQSGLRETLDESVIGNRCPVLGVCVGMQMMAGRSDEGSEDGLGWIDADVVDMRRSSNRATPFPHMGWNDVTPSESDSLFTGIKAPRFYFLHSFRFQPHNEAHTLATAVYDGEFTAAVHKDNVFGTQFHPEKSHQWGIDLLRNFAWL